MLAGVRASSDLWRLDGHRRLGRARAASTSRRSRPRRTRDRGARPDVVVHAAWSGVTASSRDDPRHVAPNVGGTLELVRQAGEAGMRAFVGLGSQAEYGPCDEPLREDMRPAPGLAVRHRQARRGRADPWAVRRLRDALRVAAADRGLRADGRPRPHLLPSVIQDLLAARRPAVSQGAQAWDYLYVEDVAEAIRAVVVDGCGAAASSTSRPSTRGRCARWSRRCAT